MPFRSRFSRPRKFSRRPRRVIRRRPKVSKKIRTYVKRAIHSNIENKEKLLYSANQSLTATSYSTQSIGLIPDISQGTENAKRVGNNIKIVKGVIKGHFNVLPYSLSTNPQPSPVWVRILLVKNLKNVGQATYLTSTDIGLIFRGNGGGIPQQFNMLDMSLPINDDQFRLLGSKTFKVGQSAAYGVSNTAGWNDDSPMSHSFYFNWGKYVKSQIKYADTDNTAQNHNLYLVFMACCADGQTNAYTPVEYHYVNHIKYEDA